MSGKNFIFCFGFISILFFSSCEAPTVETVGGTIVKIRGGNQVIKASQDILEARLSVLTKDPETIVTTLQGDVITIALPAVFDTSMVRSLIEWDRSFRLCHGLDPSIKTKVQESLSSVISIPTKKKPYKPSSMIGLVDDHNQEEVIRRITSPPFKKQFPEVRDYYWGAKKMDGKLALFMESSNSAFITEEMFQQFEGYADLTKKEGAFALHLKSEYEDHIGQLTGNDSTYLLHIFHKEVYISKIIEPHITQPNFGMSGAFSIIEAKALGAIWANSELKTPLTIISLERVAAP